MESLVKQCRESAYVAVSRRGGMVPLESVEADQPVRLVSPIGETLPLHCTAAGKAQLAFESEDELKSAPARRPEEVHRQARSPSGRRSCSSCAPSSRTGYAVDTGEYVEDVRSIAVPIKDYTAHVVGTLAVSGPAVPPAPRSACRRRWRRSSSKAGQRALVAPRLQRVSGIAPARRSPRNKRRLRTPP